MRKKCENVTAESRKYLINIEYINNKYIGKLKTYYNRLNYSALQCV